MSGEHLTPKQRRFVEEYLKTLNGTKAAMEAGYSPTSASAIAYENLRKPLVAAAIEVEMEKRSQRVRIDQDTVLTGLLDEARNANSDSARVQAWGLLGRHLAMFVDRSQVEIKGLAERIAALSDAEIEEILAGGDEAIIAHLNESGAHRAS